MCLSRDFFSEGDDESNARGERDYGARAEKKIFRFANTSITARPITAIGRK